MTDLEMTVKCAEAMGWKHLGAVGITPPARDASDQSGLWCLSGGNDWWINPEGHSVCGPCSGIPDPLNNDADAMALVKKCELELYKRRTGWRVTTDEDNGSLIIDPNLNRAIVECVAKVTARTSSTMTAVE